MTRPQIRIAKILRLQQRIAKKRGQHTAIRPLEQDLTRLMVQQLRYEMRTGQHLVAEKLGAVSTTVEGAPQ